MSDRSPSPVAVPRLTGQALATWAAGDPRDDGWIERVTAGLVAWFRQHDATRDEPIAFHTARVLFLATTPSTAPTAADLQRIATDYARTHPRSAGADPLSRVPGLVAAVSDVRIDDHDLAQAAMSASRLTHVDSDVVEACALWAIRMRHVAESGDPRAAVARALDALAAVGVSPQACARWAHRLAAITQPDPPPDGGYAVTCVVRAWWGTEPGHEAQATDVSLTVLTAGLIRATVVASPQ